MGKLCMLYNFAPKYREGIFRKIDASWDTDWFFGSNNTDIKGLDLKVLSTAKTFHNKHLKGNWYWQKGAPALVRQWDYSTYFVLGDPFCLSNWALALRLRLFHRRKRLYFWTHGWYGKESRMTATIKKLFFKLADGVFLYGNHARGLMIKEGFKPEKLFVIHNSLNYDRQLELRKGIKPSDIYERHFGNSHKTLIFIGRLTAVKRLDLLIRAMDRLKSEGIGYNLVLVGDGAQKSKIEKLVASLGMQDYVWFYGACYDEARNAELIYNADLCVAPGNVGLTAMHTMVFGTPVISHNDFKWQMPEFEAIIPGKTGDFFTKEDVKSLADAITRWFERHPDREAVRRDCYTEIDNNWTPEFQMEVLKKHLTVN